MKLKVVVGLMVLVILVFTVFGDHGLLKLVRSDRQKQAFVEQVEKLRSENAVLEERIELLTNDFDYLERIAREDLGMVKPGEFVFQFTEPEDRR